MWRTGDAGCFSDPILARQERPCFAAISLSLGYGATQAFASPAVNSDDLYCQTQHERAVCMYECNQQGLIGYCYPDIGCRCE